MDMMAQASIASLLFTRCCKCLQPEEDEARYEITVNCNCFAHDNVSYIQRPGKDDVDGAIKPERATKYTTERNLLRSQPPRRFRNVGRAICCFKITKKSGRTVASEAADVHTPQVETSDI